MAVIDTPAFQEAFETARYSIFRLETLQYYAGDPNLARFLAGEPWQDTESKRRWEDIVRRRTGEGVPMQRVHVVDEPWSDYVRFEVTWSYPVNARAGEDIRITTAQRAAWAVGDFWMFDDRRVWAMHYDPACALVDVEDRSAATSFVAACREAKAVALSIAEPLEVVLSEL